MGAKPKLDDKGLTAADRALIYRAEKRGLRARRHADLDAIKQAIKEDAMPANVLCKRSDTEWTIPSEALRSRIDRHLRKLVPYREMVYDHSTNGFYVRVVSTDAQHMKRQGPYYYKDLSGLARMLGLFHLKNGLDLPPVTNIDRRGNEYPEKPLASNLKFEVISLAYAEMARQLMEAGHTVILKGATVKPVTAPVTIDEPNPGLAPFIRDPNDDPETGEEISEEEIARLLAGPGR